MLTCTPRPQLLYLRDTLVADARAHPAKRHVYRATFVNHDRGGLREAGAKPAGRFFVPGLCDREWTASEHWSNPLAERVLGDAVPIADAYDAMKSAGALHNLGLRNGTLFDCLHWCFSWSRIFGPVWAGIAAAQRTAGATPG